MVGTYRLNHGSRKLKLIESNYKRRIGRSSNCMFYFSMPKRHCQHQRLTAPGGTSCGIVTGGEKGEVVVCGMEVVAVLVVIRTLRRVVIFQKLEESHNTREY
jgi:hypothetical protein